MFRYIHVYISPLLNLQSRFVPENIEFFRFFYVGVCGCAQVAELLGY